MQTLEALLVNLFWCLPFGYLLLTWLHTDAVFEYGKLLGKGVYHLTAVVMIIIICAVCFLEVLLRIQINITKVSNALAEVGARAWNGPFREYKQLKRDGFEGHQVDYLREYYGKSHFFVRLITCPTCLAAWLGVVGFLAFPSNPQNPLTSATVILGTYGLLARLVYG